MSVYLDKSMASYREMEECRDDGLNDIAEVCDHWSWYWLIYEKVFLDEQAEEKARLAYGRNYNSRFARKGKRRGKALPQS